jgi:hypothetical protein
MPNPIINRRLGANRGLNFNLNAALKGYWPLSDTSAALANGAADFSGNGFNLTSTTAGIISSSGGTGSISPVADYQTNFANTLGLYSANAGLNMPANQQFTATCWVNLHLQTASNPIIDNWGTSGFYLGQSGANLWTCGVHDNTNTGQFVTGGAVGGGWVFLAGGWDGANVWIQVNAGSRQSLAVAATHAFTDDLDIGRYAGSSGTSIVTNGLIGGCGLWFRSLSTMEVTQLYNGGAGLMPPPF